MGDHQIEPGKCHEEQRKQGGHGDCCSQHWIPARDPTHLEGQQNREERQAGDDMQSDPFMGTLRYRDEVVDRQKDCCAEQGSDGGPNQLRTPELRLP